MSLGKSIRGYMHDRYACNPGGARRTQHSTDEGCPGNVLQAQRYDGHPSRSKQHQLSARQRLRVHPCVSSCSRCPRCPEPASWSHGQHSGQAPSYAQCSTSGVDHVHHAGSGELQGNMVSMHSGVTLRLQWAGLSGSIVGGRHNCDKHTSTCMTIIGGKPAVGWSAHGEAGC